MGNYEDDKYLNTKATNALVQLIINKCDVLGSLNNRVKTSKDDTEIDICKRAIDIYNRRGDMIDKETEKRFGPYRRPTEETIPKYEAIQKKTLELAMLIDTLCPKSREKSSALSLLQQAKMSANASIAIYTE